MHIISFQGVCFFRQGANSVSVYLPHAERDKNPADKAKPQGPPTKHFARIFVRNDVRADSHGFKEVGKSPVRTKSKTTPVHGWQFELSKAKAAGGHTIRISPQLGDLDSSAIWPYLPSFKAFAPDIQFDPDCRRSGMVEIHGGHLNVRRTTSQHTWRVPVLGQQNQDIAMPRIAWSVDWRLQGGNTPLRISVDKGEKELAYVTLKDEDSLHPSVIIGNLDDSDSATWPNRPDQTCKGGPRCPDEDFKWLYTLFDFGNKPATPLPVPELAQPLTSASAGLDTPTCFPGGL